MRYLSQKNWQLFCSQHLSSLEQLERELLARQGISSAQEKDYFEPQLANLSNPFSFRDMALAVELILGVYKHEGEILIYGDYDCDGITATALLIRYFQSLGLAATYELPSRIDTGYGLSPEVARRIVKDSPALVITVDNGSSAYEAVDILMQAHIPVIITDHHQVPDEPAPALAFINPMRPGEDFPFKHLAGVGVAFNLLCALDQTLGLKTDLRPYLSIVALGTVADSMPLLGDNRILVSLGLKYFSQSASPGLQALFRHLRPQGNADAEFLAYTLAPRINAAGRMDDTDSAMQLLLSDEQAEIEQYLRELEGLNQARKGLENKIIQEAREALAAQSPEEKEDIILIADEDWHPGVIGIISARIAEASGLPCVCFGGVDGELRGSARSAGNFNILEALRAGEEYCLSLGGHREAAGLTILPQKFTPFAQALRKYAHEHAEDASTDVSLEIFASLSHKLITEESVQLLAKFEPFGAANPKPLFLIEDVEIISLRKIGDGSHLSANLRLDDGREIKAIAFRQAEMMELYQKDDRVDIVGELALHAWRGHHYLQVQVQAWRPSSQERARAEQDQKYWRAWQAGAKREDILARYNLPANELQLPKSLMGEFWIYLSSLLQQKPTLNFKLALLIRAFCLQKAAPISLFAARAALNILQEAGLISLHERQEGRFSIKAQTPAARPKLSQQDTWLRLAAEGGIV